MDGFYEQAYMQGQADMLMPYDVDSIEELVEKVKAEEESRIEPLIKEIREKVYEQGKSDLIQDLRCLDMSAYCPEEDGADCRYFDNTLTCLSCYIDKIEADRRKGKASD